MKQSVTKKENIEKRLLVIESDTVVRGQMSQPADNDVSKSAVRHGWN